MVRSINRCQKNHLVQLLHKLVNFIANRTVLYTRSKYTNAFAIIQLKYQVRIVFIGLVFSFFYRFRFKTIVTTTRHVARE